MKQLNIAIVFTAIPVLLASFFGTFTWTSAMFQLLAGIFIIMWLRKSNEVELLKCKLEILYIESELDTLNSPGVEWTISDNAVTNKTV